MKLKHSLLPLVAIAMIVVSCEKEEISSSSIPTFKILNSYLGRTSTSIKEELNTKGFDWYEDYDDVGGIIAKSPDGSNTYSFGINDGVVVWAGFDADYATNVPPKEILTQKINEEMNFRNQALLNDFEFFYFIFGDDDFHSIYSKEELLPLLQSLDLSTIDEASIWSEYPDVSTRIDFDCRGFGIIVGYGNYL